MTPGSRISGVLPTPPPSFGDLLANPATAVAAANLPTATPNYGQCPPLDASVSLNNIVAFGTSIPNSLVSYLNGGGAAAGIEQGLTALDMVTGFGIARANFDLTGEGTPEVVVSYSTQEAGGTLLVLNCESGRYALRYQSVLGNNPPEILRVGDMNNDGRPDLLFATEDCSDVDGLCQYHTTLITWDAGEGTFINLLNTSADGDIPAQFVDVDDDDVLEIITQQQGNGNSDTGPLRTGSQIYDWNGEGYVLSVTRPNPIRYTIQAVHEADRAFREERMDDAAGLYLYVFEEGLDELAYWYGGDERDILSSYVLYRILLTFTFAENGDPLSAYAQTRENFLIDGDNAPVFARMSDIFWNAYQESNNLNVACQPVLEFLNTRPQALDLLNRYGTRNPTYTAQGLCPF